MFLLKFDKEDKDLWKPAVLDRSCQKFIFSAVTGPQFTHQNCWYCSLWRKYHIVIEYIHCILKLFTLKATKHQLANVQLFNDQNTLTLLTENDTVYCSVSNPCYISLAGVCHSFSLPPCFTLISICLLSVGAPSLLYFEAMLYCFSSPVSPPPHSFLTPALNFNQPSPSLSPSVFYLYWYLFLHCLCLCQFFTFSLFFLLSTFLSAISNVGCNSLILHLRCHYCKQTKPPLRRSLMVSMLHSQVQIWQEKTSSHQLEIVDERQLK